ncbi:MAG TPA: YbbR-like domain-containing protein [Candidatus Eisenbacteria bacterium]|nr:YbbR-like domain-containing protein [Candidatus Eisenbacteria bacterium]
MKLLRGPFVLKALALASAVLTYYYIHNEMYQIKETSSDPSYRLIKLTAKKLPLKVRLATEPPEGYAMDESKVAANPAQVIVIGPEALLDDAFSAETSLVDVGESTKSVVKRIPVESVAGIHLSGEPYYVDVTVPIHKVEPEKPAA